jgi:hypothetical protein
MEITEIGERARRMLKIETRLGDACILKTGRATKVQRRPVHFLRQGWLMDHE